MGSALPLQAARLAAEANTPIRSLKWITGKQSTPIDEAIIATEALLTAPTGHCA
jgi:hypothetical protein